MAFTATEKAQIRTFLGYSAINRDIDPRLESIMDSIGSTMPEYETLIRADIAEIVTIETAIKNADSHLVLDRAEDVTFQGERELESLRGKGRAIIHKLSLRLNVEPRSDYFDPHPVGSMGGVLMCG